MYLTDEERAGGAPQTMYNEVRGTVKFRSDDELYEIEKQAQKLFPNTIVAKQGLEIIL